MLIYENIHKYCNVRYNKAFTTVGFKLDDKKLKKLGYFNSVSFPIVDYQVPLRMEFPIETIKSLLRKVSFNF